MIFGKSKIDKMIELNKIKVLKEKMIESVLANYKNLKPSTQAYESYKAELEKLDEKELKFLVSKMDMIPIFNFPNNLRRLRKSKAIMIHMVNKNGTINHFVISSFSRYFMYQGASYVLNMNSMY